MFEKTAALIQSLVNDQVVPGASYALLERHCVVQNDLGLAEIEPERLDLKAGQLYDLASLTKVIGTTTLLLKLREQGLLDLNTPIQKWLPEFGDARVTLRHLLTHTAGLSGYIPHRNELPPAAMKTALLGLGVNANFDQKVVYTDIGLLYVGWIIERVLGQSIQSAITQQVLQPLKMWQSTFTPRPKLCVPTEITPERGLIQGQVHDPKSFVLGEHSGAAGLFAPLSDLVLFAQFILGQLVEAQSVLQAQTIVQLFQDWTTHQLGRSLGWDLRRDPRDGHALIFHTGFTGTFILLDRQQQTGLICLTNRVHPHIQRPEIFLQRREQIVQEFLLENSVLGLK